MSYDGEYDTRHYPQGIHGPYYDQTHREAVEANQRLAGGLGDQSVDVDVECLRLRVEAAEADADRLSGLLYWVLSDGVRSVPSVRAALDAHTAAVAARTTNVTYPIAKVV